MVGKSLDEEKSKMGLRWVMGNICLERRNDEAYLMPGRALSWPSHSPVGGSAMSSFHMVLPGNPDTDLREGDEADNRGNDPEATGSNYRDTGS